MDQPTRVWKTLACLVTAMTGTAAFLGWLDPTPPLTSDVLPYGEIIRLARSAVFDDVVIRHDQWQEVEIGAADSVASGMFLSAAAAVGPRAMERGDSHFYVGRDGRAVRARRWRDQRALHPAPWAPSVSPHTIRIQVSRLREGEPMSPSQWLCVRVLVAAISEGIAPDGQGLPVRLAKGWEKVYGVEHGSMLEIVPLKFTSG